MSPFVPPGAVTITGVKEIQAALRQLDGESQKLMKAAFDDVAQILVRDVKRRMPTGPAKGGHAESTVKSTSQQREGRIREGGRKYPYVPWLDFGGTVGKGRSGQGDTNTARERSPGNSGTAGSVKRKFIRSGRYLYPSLDRNYDEVYTAMHQALIDLLEGVDWTVTGGQ